MTTYTAYNRQGREVQVTIPQDCETPEFEAGQKVRLNRQGAETLTVRKQIGTTVWVYEAPNSTIHATKLIPA